MHSLARNALVFAIFLCTGLASCGTLGDSPDSRGFRLRMVPSAGQEIHLVLKLHQKISQTIVGMEQISDQTFEYGYTQTFGESEPDDSFQISMVYDWVRAEIVLPAPLGIVAFDSRSAEGDPHPAVAGFAALVGKGFQLRVSPAGEILAVEGMTQLLEEMFAELQLPAEVSAMGDALKKQFGDDSMKELMQPFLSIYPDRDVAVGDTWRRRHEVTAVFPHSQENTYELIDRSEGICKINLNSRVTTKEGGAVMDMGVIQLQFSLSGTQSGTMTLEEATGMVHELSLHSDLSGDVHVPENPLGSWPISIKQEMTLRGVDPR